MEKKRLPFAHLLAQMCKGQSIHKSTISISEEKGKINPQRESTKEMARKIQRMNDPSYLHTVSVTELYQTAYESRPPIINGLLYAGVYILAGAPKIGKGNLTSKDLNEVVEFLVGQRGAIAHGGFSSVFSDVDAQKIRFLEIMVYAQMLKRVGLDDKEIERVLGMLFGCNQVRFSERLLQVEKENEMNE